MRITHHHISLWSAFTLVELLAVIAIIGIFPWRLLPMFTWAKERTKRTSCLNNLGQKRFGQDGYVGCVWNVLFYVAAVLWFFNLISARAELTSNEEKYLVEGVVNVETSGTPPSSAFAKTWEVPFAVNVQGRKWRIDLPNCERYLDQSFIYYFDGQSVYYLNSFPTAIERLRASGRPVANNVANARIQELPFPRDLSVPEASFLWLAYCSVSQFSIAAPNRFVPIFAYGGGGQYFDTITKVKPQQAFWTLSEQNPHVPISFTGMLGLPREFLEAAKEKITGNIPLVFTNLVYEVSGVERVGHLVVPNSASARLFHPAIEAGRVESKVVLTMQLTARTFSTRIKADLSTPPALPGLTTMVDERSPVGAVTFENQSNWIREDETTNSARFRKLKARAAHTALPRSSSSVAKYFVVGS